MTRAKCWGSMHAPSSFSTLGCGGSDAMLVTCVRREAIKGERAIRKLVARAPSLTHS